MDKKIEEMSLLDMAIEAERVKRRRRLFEDVALKTMKFFPECGGIGWEQTSAEIITEGILEAADAFATKTKEC